MNKMTNCRDSKGNYMKEGLYVADLNLLSDYPFCFIEKVEDDKVLACHIHSSYTEHSNEEYKKDRTPQMFIGPLDSLKVIEGIKKYIKEEVDTTTKVIGWLEKKVKEQEDKEGRK